MNDTPPPSTRPTRSLARLLEVVSCLVIATLSWYLLKEFATLLRPLVMAVFLCFAIYPIYRRLRRSVAWPVAVAVMVGGCVALLCLVALLVHDSVVELNADLPFLVRRGDDLIASGRSVLDTYAPWLVPHAIEMAEADRQKTPQLGEFARYVTGVTADALGEAVIVGIYLLFLFLEIGTFHQRIVRSFPAGQAEQILDVARNAQAAITRYLLIKGQASLLLAVPVALILWTAGIKFVMMWAVLTFFCNFIPYVGSFVAVSLPLLFAFLQMGFSWQPIAAAVGVTSVHLTMAYLVEPSMVGRGVGLSPLVILVALAFWGQCWGLTGMFLAVPLTVVLKLVLENVPLTRGVAQLLAD